MMKRKKDLEQIHQDLEQMYERVENLNLQIREVLDLLRRTRNREYARQLRELSRIPQSSNIHFKDSRAGLVELIPTGNVLRVFRYRKRRMPGVSSIPFVRVALLQEASPLQDENMQYPSRYLIARYDDPVHELRIRRVLLKMFRPSEIPWKVEGRVEVFQCEDAPSQQFDRLASILHEMEYEVFIHHAEPVQLAEEAEAEDEDDES